MFLKSYLHATIEGSPRVLSCHTNTSPIFYLGTIPPSHTPHTIPWGYVPLLWYLGEYGKMGFGLKTCQQNNCKRLKELFSNSIISIFRYFVAKLFRQTAVWHFIGQQPYCLGKCVFWNGARASWKIAYLVKPVISFRHMTHHSGWFFVQVPKWMVKSTNMSSFLPFLQHPDMKKKFQDTLYLYYCSRKLLQFKK